MVTEIWTSCVIESLIETTSVYVFRAKRADRLKLIYWDGSGAVNINKLLPWNYAIPV